MNPHPELDGRTPFDVALTEIGGREVEEVISGACMASPPKTQTPAYRIVSPKYPPFDGTGTHRIVDIHPADATLQPDFPGALNEALSGL